MLFKNLVRTSKRTPHFTITKINWLTLFKFNVEVHSISYRNLAWEHLVKRLSEQNCPWDSNVILSECESEVKDDTMIMNSK
jgi:hypothetical protein